MRHDEAKEAQMPTKNDSVTISAEALRDALEQARQDRARYDMETSPTYASYYDGMILAFERVLSMAR